MAEADARFGLTVCQADTVRLELANVEDIVQDRHISVLVNEVHETDGTVFPPTVTLLGDAEDEPLTPADARRLAAELIKAADIAEQTAEVTR